MRISAVRGMTKALLPLLFFALLVSSSALAGTVTGTVRNGTTGKPATGVDVILIQLQGGMQPVANTKTDASGVYKFDNPNLGTDPMLIRAVYRGVNYHEPVTPGKTTVDVQVFEHTDKPSAFALTARAIILQPNGSDLEVGEEYNIQNKTQPPVAYYRDDGSFVFSLPDGAQLDQVSAEGSAGMPTVQTTIDKGKNQEAIVYAFRPGDSSVRVAYKLAYPGNATKMNVNSPYPSAHVAIFAPPSVHVTSDGFVPAGTEQGFNVYMRDTVAANTPISISVSGTAPPPPAADGSNGTSGGGGASASSSASSSAPDDTQNPSVNSRADTGTEAPTASVTALPARIDNLKWILVAGFAAIFVLGLVFLMRRPDVNGMSAMPGMEVAGAPAAAYRSSQERQSAPVSAASSTPEASPTVASLDREVRGGLDEMKDLLFRLELRRQAGTITEDDYAREHARVEKILRDLVRG